MSWLCLQLVGTFPASIFIAKGTTRLRLKAAGFGSRARREAGNKFDCSADQVKHHTVSLQWQREKLLVRFDQVFVAVFRYRAGVFDLHGAPACFVV